MRQCWADEVAELVRKIGERCTTACKAFILI